MRTALLCIFSMIPLAGFSQEQKSTESAHSWYQSGQAELEAALQAQTQNRSRAKNIILFIGDGMGVSTVTAGRIYDGQSRGEPGEENLLYFETFPYLGLSKTYNTNQQTPDSAGTMTAMISGIKSKAGFIGIDQSAERGNCNSAKGTEVDTLLDYAESAGLSTGIVSTARITHATPAATYSHSPERDWESDADIPNDEAKNGCKDIAWQLIHYNESILHNALPKKQKPSSKKHSDGIEVILGGGRRNFLPSDHADSNFPQGKRKDGANLISQWLTKYTNSQYAADKQSLDAIDIESTDFLLGLFNQSHMKYEVDRLATDDAEKSQEPSIAEMTEKAIRILQKNEKGFFLMVEAGRIDHGHHAGNALRALKDTQAFSDAVKMATQLVDTEETLIIVTADHSHTLTIAGYPTRGNPILGKAVSNDSKGNPQKSAQLAMDRLPYTTLGYRNGPGNNGTGRKDLSKTDTEAKNFRQEALVPMPSESHGGEDVAIYAIGPWAHLFHKTHEQHYIFHVMQHAMNPQ